MVSDPEPSIRVRPLTPEDAPVFRALRLAALEGSPEAFGSSPEEEAQLSVDDVRARMSRPGPNAIFGGFAGDRLAGMAGFSVNERVKARHKGVMWGVYVVPEWRGRGLGRDLVRHVIAHAAQHVLMLEAAVGLTNASARRTYHALGFKPYGIERKAIRVGDAFHDEELLFIEFDASGFPLT